MQKKKEEKKNRDPKVSELVSIISKAYAKDKAFTEAVLSPMQELRTYFIELEQPTLVKAIRLVYEYAAAFDGFVVSVWEEDNNVSSLEYFLGLLENFQNKYNREEIKTLNVFLKARLLGEDAEFVRPEDDDEA